MSSRIFIRYITSMTSLLINVQVFATTKNPISIAWEAPPRTLDPRYAADANSQYLENLTHCALIAFDADGKAVGQLAAKWTWKSAKQLDVELHPDFKFRDGTPVTAADVASTYNFFKSKHEPASPRAGAFRDVASVVAPSAHRVVFELAAPDASFVTNLVVGILPTKLAQGPMLESPEAINGCGPYHISAVSVSDVQLQKNANFSRANPKAPDTLLIKIVKDEQTRYAKAITGELDLVQNLIGRDKLDEIAKKYPALTVHRRPGLNVTYLGFNMRDPILSKPEVRRAIGLAIDREAIIKHLLRGYAVPAASMLTPSDPYLDASLKPVTMDLAQAKQLLDQAGFKDPDGDGSKPRFTIEYKTTTDLTRVSIAKAIAGQLQKAGIKVKVQALEWGKFKADVEAGRVQMWSLSWIGFKDPDIFRFAFGTENFPPNGANRGWYSNPELDKVLTDARIAIDDKTRSALYSKAQAIVANELPYVFLWHEDVVAVASKRLPEFRPYADGRLSGLFQP